MSGPRPSPRSSRWLVEPLLSAVAVAALGGWLLWWRGDLGVQGQWTWTGQWLLALAPAGVRALVLLSAATAALLVWLSAPHPRRRRYWPLVLLAVLAASALQLSAVQVRPAGLPFVAASVCSDVATEYFSAAEGIADPLEYVRTYARGMGAGHHVGTHPPGVVLLYWAAQRLYASPLFPRDAFEALLEVLIGGRLSDLAAALAGNASLGARATAANIGAAYFCAALFGLCSALVAVPLYALGAVLLDRQAGLLAAALWVGVPSAVLNFQGPDALLALLVAVALLLVVMAARCRSPLWAAGAGVLLGKALLISFGVLAALALAGLCLLLWTAPAAGAGRLPRRCAARCLLALVLGVAVVPAVAQLLLGADLPAVFRQAMAAHHRFTLAQRPYPQWVGRNLLEFAVFGGLPILVSALGGLGADLRALVRRRDLAPVAALTLSGVATLLLLDAAGSVRGEVGRIWLFLMPPLVLAAAAWLRRGPEPRRTRFGLCLSLSLTQLVIMAVAFVPLARPY